MATTEKILADAIRPVRVTLESDNLTEIVLQIVDNKRHTNKAMAIWEQQHQEARINIFTFDQLKQCQQYRKKHGQSSSIGCMVLVKKLHDAIT